MSTPAINYDSLQGSQPGTRTASGRPRTTNPSTSPSKDRKRNAANRNAGADRKITTGDDDAAGASPGDEWRPVVLLVVFIGSFVMCSFARTLVWLLDRSGHDVYAPARWVYDPNLCHFDNSPLTWVTDYMIAALMIFCVGRMLGLKRRLHSSTLMLGFSAGNKEQQGAKNTGNNMNGQSSSSSDQKPGSPEDNSSGSSLVNSLFGGARSFASGKWAAGGAASQQVPLIDVNALPIAVPSQHGNNQPLVVGILYGSNAYSHDDLFYVQKKLTEVKYRTDQLLDMAVGMLAMYASSVLFGAIAHQTQILNRDAVIKMQNDNRSADEHNAFDAENFMLRFNTFRILWTLCVGSVTMAQWFQGGVGTVLHQLALELAAVRKRLRAPKKDAKGNRREGDGNNNLANSGKGGEMTRRTPRGTVSEEDSDAPTEEDGFLAAGRNQNSRSAGLSDHDRNSLFMPAGPGQQGLKTKNSFQEGANKPFEEKAIDFMLNYMTVLPKSAWFLYAAVCTGCVAWGSFSFQRPAADIFACGVLQTFSTVYVILVTGLVVLLFRSLQRMRDDCGSRSLHVGQQAAANKKRTGSDDVDDDDFYGSLSGTGEDKWVFGLTLFSYIHNAPLIVWYPLFIYLELSLGTINFLLHMVWLFVAWGGQAWATERVVALISKRTGFCM